jgi:hypothetical protein
MFEDVIATPWDSRTFGFNTFEIVYTSDVNLKKTLERIFQENRLGHYTVKLTPLNNKKILHEFGFYYGSSVPVMPNMSLFTPQPI